MTRSLRTVSLAAFAFALAACGDDATAPVASSVTLTPSATGSLASIGETRTVAAVVKTSGGAAISGATITYTSSNPAVATVAGTGASATVTAVSNGSATITATSGSATGTLDVAVAQKLVTLAVSAASASIAPGATSQLTGTGRDALGNAIAGITGVSYTTAAARTAVVSSTGLATAIAPGTVAITGSLTRDGVTATASTNLTVTTPTAGFFTQMNGANERPAATPTTSNGSALFTQNGTTINFVVTYQGLQSAPTGLHIHSPAGSTVNAGVSVDLLGTNQLPSTGVLTGSFTAANIRTAGVSLDSMLVLIRSGNAYVNVHSTVYPAGEIRGQLGTP